MAEKRFTFYNVGNDQNVLLPMGNETNIPLDSLLMA